MTTSGSNALGLIETKGLVGAIEALDACLKAANVSLAGLDLVTGGLVTIRVTGDVGAVKSAVLPGEAAARRLGVFIASHTIPRPHSEIESIAFGPGNGGPTHDREAGAKRGPAPSVAPVAELPSQQMVPGDAKADREEKPTIPEEMVIEATSRIRRLIDASDAESILAGASKVSDLTLSKLRRLARVVPGMTLSGADIANSRRHDLLAEIVRAALGSSVTEDSPSS